jgi:hypothetical protein
MVVHVDPDRTVRSDNRHDLEDLTISGERTPLVIRDEAFGRLGVGAAS